MLYSLDKPELKFLILSKSTSNSSQLRTKIQPICQLCFLCMCSETYCYIYLLSGCKKAFRFKVCFRRRTVTFIPHQITLCPIWMLNKVLGVCLSFKVFNILFLFDYRDLNKKLETSLAAQATVGKLSQQIILVSGIWSFCRLTSAVIPNMWIWLFFVCLTLYCAVIVRSSQ